MPWETLSAALASLEQNLSNSLQWIGEKISLIVSPDPATPLILGQQLATMNYDTSNIIASFLSPKTMNNMSNTCKDGQDLFKKPLEAAVQTRLAPLLEHVVRGEQEEAEAILDQNPSLLLKKGEVTDYSGRTFSEITAFQCALWAKDRHMWQMIRKYLPDAAAAQQLQEHENEDEATKAAYVKKHGRHYRFEGLKNAYQAYNNYTLTKSTPSFSAAQVDALWLALGKEQRLVPPHVAQEYCRRDRTFHPLPSFKENNLPRQFELTDTLSRTLDTWFPLVPNRLGKTFAVYRNWLVSSRGGAQAGYPGGRLGCWTQTIDAAAIAKLDAVRTQEYHDLKNSLIPVPTETVAITCPMLRLGR